MKYTEYQTYHEALESLPEEYRNDKTHFTIFKDKVIAVNNNLQAIMFLDGIWKEVISTVEEGAIRQ